MQVAAALQSEKKRLSTQVVSRFSKKALEKIFELQSLLPEELRYNRKQIAAYLRDKQNVHLFLYNGSKLIGYIFGQPHNDVVKALKKDDPLMTEDSACYYVDQVIIAPTGRVAKSCLIALAAFFGELNRRGCYRYSAHVLTVNGFDKYIEMMLCKILIQKRTTRLPSFGNYTYVYMEAEGVFRA